MFPRLCFLYENLLLLFFFISYFFFKINCVCRILTVEFKIFVSVERQGDMGLPFVDIREHITSPKFTGFTQKGVVVPLQLYPQFVDMLLKTLNQQEVQKALQDLRLAEKED